jgi:hypothetical protein
MQVKPLSFLVHHRIALIRHYTGAVPKRLVLTEHHIAPKDDPNRYCTLEALYVSCIEPTKAQSARAQGVAAQHPESIVRSVRCVH